MKRAVTLRYHRRMVVNRIIAACWISFAVYWLVSAFFTKRTARRSPRWGGHIARIVIVLLGFLAMRSPVFWRMFEHIAQTHFAISSNPVIRDIGAATAVFGIAFAIWARTHLGRNWGQPMTLREGHELVTTGPYALVRHPIYTGVISALLGTALAENFLLLIPFAALSGFYVLSAATEEKHMLHQFPDTYSQYRSRTKMLIPYVI